MALKTEGRFWVQLISRDALRQYMKHRDFSIQGLADRIGVSKSTIGHLHSGKRNTVRPETAKAIEKALDAPSGSLFLPRVTPVTRTTQHHARGARM